MPSAHLIGFYLAQIKIQEMSYLQNKNINTGLLKNMSHWLKHLQNEKPYKGVKFLLNL